MRATQHRDSPGFFVNPRLLDISLDRKFQLLLCDFGGTPYLRSSYPSDGWTSCRLAQERCYLCGISRMVSRDLCRYWYFP